MKKSWKGFLALVMILAMVCGTLTGCGSSSGSSSSTNTASNTAAATGSNTAAAGNSTTASSSGKSYKVAVIVKKQDMYGAWLALACEAEAKNYPGITCDSFDYENDETKYLQICDNVSQSGYNLVISQTPKMDARQAIKEIQDSGAIFFHISSAGWEYIRDEKLAEGMTCNEYSLGEIVAEQAAKDLPKDAKIVILLGPAGKQNSIDRDKAYHDVLTKERPDVQILDEQIANWNKDEAMKKMDDWTQAYDHIDGVLAVNDAMATGAVESLLGNGFTDWDNMYIYGIDGLTDSCTYISKGYMRASALQDATVYAKKAFELFDQNNQGTINMNDPNWFTFEPSLVTKDNCQKQLDYYKEQGLLK